MAASAETPRSGIALGAKPTDQGRQQRKAWLKSLSYRAAHLTHQLVIGLEALCAEGSIHLLSEPHAISSDPIMDREQESIRTLQHTHQWVK